MTPSRHLLVAAFCFAACSRSAPVPAARPRPPSPARPDAAPVAGGAAAALERKRAEPAELQSEEPEPNPYSESVTLKLAVTPQVKAQINWGAKTVARVEPGKMEAEISRPRGSGPVDVEVKAEGYLPYHTRLYADRNDKIGVRLYRPEEAPNLFGYRRSAEGKKNEAEKQK